LGDDIPVCLAELTPDGRVLRASARFRSLVGRTAEELAGLPLALLLHEDERAGHEQDLRELASVPYRRDARLLRADGTVILCTLHISAGPGSGCLTLVAEAAPAQLVRAEAARERAEAEGRRRDEFLSVLSHELRSPLAAILVWTRLLRESGGEVDAGRGLEVIERSGRSLERILDDLVHVSRISSGKLQLTDRCPLDLRAIAQAACEGVAAEAATKGVRLVRTLPSDPVQVSGDAGRLQQAITNILSNAVKFTPAEGQVELTVERDEGLGLVRVADTGEGMSEAFLPLAFERFRQGDSTTTRAHHGLGLGLYIVRHLVALHGGRVRAASPGRGKGSIFTISLPLLEETAEAAPPAAATAGAASLREGLRVLVVDDDDDTREALRLILKQSGLRVETASSAAEAIERLRATRPDVMLSDIAMPGEDGLTLIGRVRALPTEEGGSVPAAALTAYASPAEREAALRAGFDWHVAKPVDPPELMQVIATLVQRRTV
jgi:PAS domain S-box-containing protein